VDTENKFVKSEDELWDVINKVADQLLGLSKATEQKTKAPLERKGRLFVKTKPKDARIRVLNIKPKFYQGMELEPGSYHVEVSAFNYATQKTWVKVSAGEDGTITVRLTEATTSNVLQQAIGYYTGTSGKVDEEKARMLFIEAAENDDPLARMWVARCYHKGRCGFPENDARAKEMAERVIKQVKSLANEGNNEAMFLLANAYGEGLAITEDHVQAIYWYRKAAKKGEATAMTNLGWYYYNGKGVTKDFTQAVYWYRKASEKGEPRGMNNLGVCYENGHGVTKDKAQAVYWYRKAAEKGDATAMNHIGWMYDHGEGVKEDDKQAVFWFRKASEKGDATAMNNLGVCYENGSGVIKDMKQAVYWYRKAAEKKHSLALKRLKELGY
jgi:TPR repeat protein